MTRVSTVSAAGPVSGSALYVHLPFCKVHCSYCPFAVTTDLRLQERYVAALEREIAARSSGERLASVYFGGGTPSRLDAQLFERLMDAIRGSFEIVPSAEITVEANPEDVDQGLFDSCSAAGVNRLSIGIQSLHDEELYPLGRGHSRQIALTALERASRQPFRTNADLIIGLPRQTAVSFETSLRELLAFGTGHLSLYMLDLEGEGTALERQVKRGAVVLPEDEMTTGAYLQAIEICADHGLAHYEISNFARPGEESSHNLRYWQREPYLGVGMSAHSFDGALRQANARDIHDYLQRIETTGTAKVFEERLTPEEVRQEEIFLALRQKRGIGYAHLLAAASEGEAWLNEGLRDGWLERRGERVCFTSAGFLLSSDYISRLF